jgi:CBS domain-containing protein
MDVSTLVHRYIVTCSDRDTLEHAARLMWVNTIGCLPVVSPERRVIGVLTDRDICMAAYLHGAPLRSITVSSVMSKELVTCRVRDEVCDVQQMMRERQIRRVLAIDDDGALIGMVSLDDLACAADANRLPSAEVAATLAAASRDRHEH